MGNTVETKLDALATAAALTSKINTDIQNFREEMALV